MHVVSHISLYLLPHSEGVASVAAIFIVLSSSWICYALVTNMAGCIVFTVKLTGVKLPVNFT